MRFKDKMFVLQQRWGELGGDGRWDFYQHTNCQAPLPVAIPDDGLPAILTLYVGDDVSEHAERILPNLERKFPILDIIETPIPQEDVAGGKRVQAATKTRIAHHYGSPPVTVQLEENLCDGFVVSSGPKYGGGLSKNMQQAAVCAMAGKPLWLQHVGTGLTAAFSLHVAAVLPAAKWAAVNCHQLFRDDLLKPTFTVKNGTAAIPEGPGLGFDLDTDALEAFRIETPKEKPFGPDRLLRVA